MDEDVTDFIRNKAVEYEKRDKCRTYIYFDSSYIEEIKKLRVIGFFSVAMKTMKVPILNSMSKNLRKKLGNISDCEENLVTYLIGQLGRDSSYTRDTLDGKKMLQDCYGLIAGAREIVGGRLILVECKPIEKVCKIYEDEGFIDITENGDGLKQYIRFIV
ncbi:MAG: hypothetical protein FIA99_06945 [Ruminiclostridium sp.]|nr:hypothetical protein [Ruminiclostridium sp.]